MLEQIAQLVQQYGQQSVVNNPKVPNNLNNQVMAEAASTITGGLQNMLSGGGLESILSLFTGRQSQSAGITANPIVSMMVGHLTSKLAANLKLNPAIAGAIAQSIIPAVLNGLVSNTRSNDPAHDAFDLNDLIASLTGGNAAADNRQTNGIDFQQILTQFAQGGQAQMPSLGNIINAVTQQAQQQSNRSSGGGLANLIQGFFK